jgi:YHS domain-containing protein
MIRPVLYLLIAIFARTLLRYVVGSAMRMISDFLHPVSPSRRDPSSQRAEASGELKRDPVCGTFVAETTSVKGTFHGEVIHFCSSACRDKYKRS